MLLKLTKENKNVKYFPLPCLKYHLAKVLICLSLGLFCAIHLNLGNGQLHYMRSLCELRAWPLWRKLCQQLCVRKTVPHAVCSRLSDVLLRCLACWSLTNPVTSPPYSQQPSPDPSVEDNEESHSDTDSFCWIDANHTLNRMAIIY